VADSIRRRKAVHNLQPAELTALRKALRGMMDRRDNRGYAWHAGQHGVAAWLCWHHSREQFRPGAPLELFLPWHRAYLYGFEMALRDIDPDVTLPFWDWTHDPGIPPAFDAAKLPDGNANPLYSARIDVDKSRADPPRHGVTSRDPDPTQPLPSKDEIDKVLGVNGWSRFTSDMEGQLHDRVHGWVGGDMGQVDWAAYDPIFWVHHCQVDRLWWVWQTRRGVNTISPDLMDIVLEPFPFTVRQVLSISDLHYAYAASETVVGGTNP